MTAPSESYEYPAIRKYRNILIKNR